MQINNYFRILKNEFQGYNLSSFRNDLLAGITCTAVALPLALAFGVSSGADAASGLICAILAGLIIGLLSGASYQISGPTGAMAAILVSLSAQYGLQGVFAASFLSGVILLIFAALKAGKLVSFIPKPVVTGFTSGIAIIIALGQVDNAFGTASSGSSAIMKLISYGKLGFHPSITVTAITILTILIMVLWPKKLNKVFPGSLLAIIIALALELIFSFDIPTVGAIPRTLLPAERLKLSSLSPSYLGALFSPALSIALLGMIESLLCGASGAKMKGEKIDSTQELYAQGIGNAIIPFFGGIPATAAIARTSVAIKSGGKTRVVSIIHSIGLLLSMFLLGPYMARIPLSALAGVLMVTAWRMNEWKSIKLIFSHRIKTSITQYFVTMIATVVFDLTTAILIGIGISMILFTLRMTKDLNIEIDKADIPGSPIPTRIAYIDGALFFGTQDRIMRAVEEMKKDGVKRIILSFRGVSIIDHSEAEELEEIFKSSEKEGVEVYLCGLSGDTARIFERLDMDFYKAASYSSVITCLEALGLPGV